MKQQLSKEWTLWNNTLFTSLETDLTWVERNTVDFLQFSVTCVEAFSVFLQIKPNFRGDRKRLKHLLDVMDSLIERPLCWNTERLNPLNSSCFELFNEFWGIKKIWIFKISNMKFSLNDFIQAKSEQADLIPTSKLVPIKQLKHHYY